jgi:hypothetical protein
MHFYLKYSFLLILSLTLLHSSAAQIQQTDLDEMDLSGNVQTVSHVEYSVDNDQQFMKEASFLTHFNPKGYTLQQKHYNRSSRLDSKTFFEYDNEGRYTNSKKYTIHKSLDSSLTSQDILTYTPKEKKITLDHYTSRGIRKGTTIWIDDTIKIIGYDPNGTIMITRVQLLNKEGKRISEENYIKNNVFMSKMTWKYSKKKVIIKRYDKEGTLSSKHIQKLDANGNVISWIFSSSKKSKKYTYKYDSKKNWIQKITYKEGKITAKIEREISYY